MTPLGNFVRTSLIQQSAIEEVHKTIIASKTGSMTQLFAAQKHLSSVYFYKCILCEIG
jgi:hypothetical protein